MSDSLDAAPGRRQVRAPQVLKGFRDFLPERMILRQRVIAILRETYERHGFEPIETPALEYYETLAGKYGEDEKLIYHFPDHGGREIGMRYDLTVPLARFVAVHRNELTFPFKRYHIAPVWRADRPQRGRYREFWQCDADIVGTRSMLADADVISIVIEALSAINIPNFVVHINHRKLLESLAIYAGVQADRAGSVYRAIDKLAKIGEAGVAQELVAAGVETATAARVIELVSTSGSPDVVIGRIAERLEGIAPAREALDDITSLFEFLAALGAPAEHYTLDLALARGLAYYTGPVFEAIVDEPKMGSLVGAGRYDGLVGMFSSHDIPATGMSVGLERIIDVVEELRLLDVRTTISEALVTIFPDDGSASTHEALRLVAELRRAGVRAEATLEEGRDLGRQFRYAVRRGVPFALVIGPDEVQRGVVAVKDLQNELQVDVPRATVAAYLRERVRAQR
ncbi:MAG: histidine--tRNA ligase [Chloroflexi bacterium]|nr:MAG: histidine--tRNA ligase [Chloroflexota bacterium]